MTNTINVNGTRMTRFDGCDGVDTVLPPRKSVCELLSDASKLTLCREDRKGNMAVPDGFAPGLLQLAGIGVILSVHRF
jgi:hypothetical protein